MIIATGNVKVICNFLPKTMKNSGMPVTHRRLAVVYDIFCCLFLDESVIRLLLCC